MKQSFAQRIAAPAKQYSYIQVYGFSLVPMDGAQELAFDGGYSTVQLPWRFSFGGVPYNTMYVSQRWSQERLVTQGVLTQKGDVYYVYSGQYGTVTTRSSA
eukprot:m51a1_g12089 hypothetical protein (101) ;mRNA; f:1234-3807